MGKEKNISIPVLDEVKQQCVYTPAVRQELYAFGNTTKLQSSFEPSVIYDEARQMCLLPEGITASDWCNAVTARSAIPAGITFGKYANRDGVSSYTLTILSGIMKDSDNPNIIITSTLRTPEDQARAMYNNIQNHDFAFSYALYGSAGDKVTKAAEDATKKGLHRDQIIAAMVQEINRIGPRKISRHMGDPDTLNVVDIAPSSIVNKHSFVREVKKRKVFLLEPPSDPAFHLEIKQPRK